VHKNPNLLKKYQKKNDVKKAQSAPVFAKVIIFL
jgi:hypothetical protein